MLNLAEFCCQKPKNLPTTLIWGDGFFHWKIDFLFCLNSFVQDCRIYTNLQSKVCFQSCFQVRRPVISTIVNPFMSFYEKLLLRYLIHENSKCQHFFISEKTDRFFNFWPHMQKGHHFSITKLKILIFSNCYILK